MLDGVDRVTDTTRCYSSSFECLDAFIEKALALRGEGVDIDCSRHACLPRP
tara:strand:+ start:28538 stop:28690 length:153 start_codon:yes stop_codon:yes gene_type:complete